MKWSCEYCSQKLKGNETYCPKCGKVIVYRCHKCGKELDNGKRKICPLCSTERNEKIKSNLKKIGAGVGAAATAVVFVLANAGNEDNTHEIETDGDVDDELDKD